MKPPAKRHLLLLICVLALPHIGAQASDQSMDAQLLVAIKTRDLKQAEALLDRGANPNARDSNGERTTAVMWALAADTLNVPQPLADRANRTFDPDRRALTSLLLRHGADLTATDRFGVTLLMMTVAHDPARAGDEMSWLSFLIHRGLNPRTKDHEGRTALMYAAENGNVPMAEFLLRRGVNVNARDRYGITALGRAALRQKAEAVKFLLTQGADANAVSNFGCSVLSRAIQGGDATTVQALLDAGAKVSL